MTAQTAATGDWSPGRGVSLRCPEDAEADMCLQIDGSSAFREFLAQERAPLPRLWQLG